MTSRPTFGVTATGHVANVRRRAYPDASRRVTGPACGSKARR